MALAVALVAATSAVLAFMLGKRHNRHLRVNALVEDLRLASARSSALTDRIHRTSRLQTLLSTLLTVLAASACVVGGLGYLGLLSVARAAVVGLGVVTAALGVWAARNKVGDKVRQQRSMKDESVSLVDMLLADLLVNLGDDLRSSIIETVALDAQTQLEAAASIREEQVKAIDKLDRKAETLRDIDRFYQSVMGRVSRCEMGKRDRPEIDEEYVRGLRRYFTALEAVGQSARDNKTLDTEISVDDIRDQ